MIAFLYNTLNFFYFGINLRIGKLDGFRVKLAEGIAEMCIGGAAGMVVAFGIDTVIMSFLNNNQQYYSIDGDFDIYKPAIYTPDKTQAVEPTQKITITNASPTPPPPILTIATYIGCIATGVLIAAKRQAK